MCARPLMTERRPTADLKMNSASTRCALARLCLVALVTCFLFHAAMAHAADDAAWNVSSLDRTMLQPPGLPSDPAPYAPQAIEDQSAAPAASPSSPTPAKKKPAPPPAPYKGVFYDNDFSYLTKPDNKYCYFGDCLKRNECGDCWLYDIGGEYRARHHHEVNLRGSNLSGLDDDFLLHR